MSDCLESYGEAIFVLVLIAILVAFASPLGKMIKDATTKQVSQTEEIGNDEIYVATTGRPKPPNTAVDQVYCIYYDDGEMTISQNDIESEVGRTVVKKGFYSCPMHCTTKMTIVRFVGAVRPKRCQQWFSDCTNLTEFKNIENLYTDKCTNMTEMFYNCKNLTSLNLKNFDTSNVTNMNTMFFHCEDLTSLNLTSFDTSNLTSMYYMFSCCSSLTNLDLSSFDTNNVTDMTDMFSKCNSLTNLDLNSFDTSNVTKMNNMFSSCSSLTSLDLSKWNTSNVISMYRMFFNCCTLKDLNISNFNGTNVKNVEEMFKFDDFLQINCIKISKNFYDKLLEKSNNLYYQMPYYIGISNDAFDIVK